MAQSNLSLATTICVISGEFGAEISNQALMFLTERAV
jgi:hypothetical protein